MNLCLAPVGADFIAGLELQVGSARVCKPFPADLSPIAFDLSRLGSARGISTKVFVSSLCLASEWVFRPHSSLLPPKEHNLYVDHY